MLGYIKLQKLNNMKELVREIFGDEAAEDEDIVNFYIEVNKTGIGEEVENLLQEINHIELNQKRVYDNNPTKIELGKLRGIRKVNKVVFNMFSKWLIK